MNPNRHNDSKASTEHLCITFLCALDSSPNALFNIECYTDVPKGTAKPKPDSLMAQFAGRTIEEVQQLIPELNRLTERGAGIFTTVNRCIGHRSINNVSKVRAVHADLDDATSQQHKTLIESLTPSIIVKSSDPTKQHLYWLLDEASAKEKDAVGLLNRILARDYGADKAATDIARILRPPGFKHMKYRHLGQTPVVTASYNNRIYSLAEVQAAFPPTQPTPTQYQTRRGSTDNLSKVEAEVIAEIKARCPQLWSGAWEQA